MLPAPWNSIHCEKKSRSFIAENLRSKGWCIKNETHVWASGAFIIHFSEFWIKYVKIYIKFLFIWCTLLFCSLIFIRVTWENVKIYIFQICRKKLQEIAKLQYFNLRASKVSIIQFLESFHKIYKTFFHLMYIFYL